MLKEVNNIAKQFLRYLTINKDDRLFRTYCESNKKDRGKYKGTVLFDCTHGIYPKWNYKHFHIANKLRENGYHIDGYYPSKLLVWKNWKVYLLWFFYFFYNKDKFISECVGIDTLCKINMLNISDLRISFRKALNIYRKTKNKRGVLNIVSDDEVVIGDLIYDTYLKWFKEPTFDVNSLRAFYVYWVTFYLESRVSALLKSRNYKAIYLTHSTYVSFGLVARLGVHHNAKVFIMENTRGTTLQDLDVNHYLQIPRFENYIQEIKDLQDKNIDYRDIAKLQIESRLSGVIDSSIWYMKKSAYSNGGVEIKIEKYFEDRPTALLLLHCFFDSPHIYNWMIFEDFYEWVNYILSYCQKNKINVAVKRHPNGLLGNEKVVKKFMNKYPFATFLDSSVSNNALVCSGEFDFALTVYGTMAHEFAYQGMTVINAGDNPHSFFNFCLTPKNKSELTNAIDRCSSGYKLKINKEEILDFYYAHYILKRDNCSILYMDNIEGKFNFKSKFSDLIDSLGIDEMIATGNDVERIVGLTL